MSTVMMRERAIASRALGDHLSFQEGRDIDQRSIQHLKSFPVHLLLCAQGHVALVGRSGRRVSWPDVA